MKKIFLWILVAFLFITVTGCGSKKTDAIKFKEEYESLNGEKGYGDNINPEVKISKKNVVKYVDADKVIDILDNGTGIIYFGYPSCPWCRNAVPVLLEAAEELNVKDIYYMNLKDERDTIEVMEDGTLKTTKEGSEDYKKLLERLDSILDEYVLGDLNGNEVKTGEKRIFVPLVVFVRDGKIVGFHADTVSSQTNPYVALNEDQKNELLDIYIDLIHKVLNDVCDSSC